MTFQTASFLGGLVFGFVLDASRGVWVRSLVTDTLKRTGFSAAMVSAVVVAVVVVVVLAVVAALVTEQFLLARRRRIALAAEVSHPSADNIKRVFRDTGLPFFLENPEVMHTNVEFVNATLKLLWQRIDRAGTEWAFTDRHLERLMNDEHFWKPQWMRATGIVLQSLSLGHKPPKVSGIKVYKHRGRSAAGGLVMDCQFSWRSALEVQIAMKSLDSVDNMTIVDRLLSCVYRAVTITAVVRNLVARGMIRVTISPLLDSLPIVGAVRVSLLEPPSVSYDVSSMGANPLLIPGLEAWLRGFIEETVMDPFTYPDGVTIDVAKLFGKACDTHLLPQGILCVTVISGTGIPRTDWFGSSDPYIRIWVERSKQQNTSVRANTLSPSWNEEFDMLVYDLDHQRLNLQLYDSESLGPDVLIGEAAIPLSAVEWNMGVAEITVPLDVIYGDRRKKKSAAKRARRGGGQVDRALSSSSYGSGELIVSSPRYQDGLKDGLKAAIKGLGAFAATKPCTVRLKMEYLAFERAHTGDTDDSDVDQGEVTHQGSATTAETLSARAQRFVNGGFLHVHVNRCLNLQSSAQLTKKFKIVVSVIRNEQVVLMREHSKSGLSKSNSSVNPVFDISTDVLLDSETAQDPDTELSVEILVDHYIKKPSSRGKATISMQDIVDAGRLHDRWKLVKEGDEHDRGLVEMTVTYTSTV